MVTCDFCEKELDRPAFCSGACKMKHRRTNKETPIVPTKILKKEKKSKPEKKIFESTDVKNWSDPYSICKTHRIYKQSCGCK